MKYIIIGLGNYGRVLAEELSALGHEIIGADISESRVDSIKDKVATAFVIDATDEQALSVLPLNSVDIVIVAIGENFGASVRVVALLKQKKVAHIYARAIDMVHKAVLEAFPQSGATAGFWNKRGSFPCRFGILCRQVYSPEKVCRILCQ